MNDGLRLTYRMEKANPSDCADLSEIARTSKAYWGYSDDLLKLWEDDLTISPDFIRDNVVIKCVQNSKTTIGFCAISNDRLKAQLEVEHLWVLPDYIGNGLGKRLLKVSLNECKDLEAESVKVVSDPNAQPFYEQLGFNQKEMIPSKPEGRMLPVLEMQLKPQKGLS